MRRRDVDKRPATMAVLVLVAAVLVFVPSASAAGGEPEIVNAQATYITEQGARLGAQIDPVADETAYEIWLECQSVPGGPCEPVAPQRQGGDIAAGSGVQSVSADVAGLQPGDSYSFGVLASNAAGRVQAHLSFETQPLGACAAGCPYKTGVSLEAIELGRLLAEGAPAREAARQQAAKEQAEREAALAKADQPAPPAATSSPAATVTGGLSLAGTRVSVRGDGVALVKLTCLGVASCRGKLTLTAKSTVEAKGAKGEQGKPGPVRPVRIGTAGFSIAGDEAKTVKVKLDAAGRALLGADHGYCGARLALRELAPGAASMQVKGVWLVRGLAVEGIRR